jgi:hypothetical protein
MFFLIKGVIERPFFYLQEIYSNWGIFDCKSGLGTEIHNGQKENKTI